MIDEITIRLDRVYFDELGQSSVINGDVKHTVEDENQEGQIAALEEELATLYPEIASVAEMSVRQQFLEPLTEQLRSSEARSERESRLVVDHVS